MAEEKLYQTKSRTQRLNEILEDSQNKSYFVAAVTVIFAILFVVFAILPAFSSVINQNTENDQIREAIEDVEKKIETIQGMVNEQETKGAVLGFFDDIFPENNDPQEDIVADLFARAEDREIIVLSSTFSEQVNDTEVRVQWAIRENVRTGMIQMQLSGSKDQLFDFIQEIEDLGRIYAIDSMSIFADTDETLLDIDTLGEQRYRLNASIMYFYWVNQAGI
jgi:Tfp pilus assembly protein PilO